MLKYNNAFGLEFSSLFVSGFGSSWMSEWVSQDKAFGTIIAGKIIVKIKATMQQV